MRSPSCRPSVAGGHTSLEAHPDRPRECGTGGERTDAGLPGKPVRAPGKFVSTRVSGTRFRITGTEDLDSGLTAGVNLEYAAGDNGNSPTLRHSNVYLSGEEWGTFTFGHTAPATNGTNDDLSASSLAVDMACSDAVGKELRIIRGAAAGSVNVCTDFTAGRRGVVRYNTPGNLPVGAGVAFADNLWDAQVTLSGGLGAGSYALRASYADNDSVGGIDDKTMSLAAAVKFSGVSVSTLWGRVNPDGDNNNITGYGVKLGYDFDDATGIGVLYRSGEGEWSTVEPSVWGIGAQRNLSDNVSAFTGYYVADWDDAVWFNTDNRIEEVKTFNVGMRVKF